MRYRTVESILSGWQTGWVINAKKEAKTETPPLNMFILNLIRYGRMENEIAFTRKACCFGEVNGLL